MTILQPRLLTLCLYAALGISVLANDPSGVGYNCYPECLNPTIPANETSKMSFGKSFAVLNLDCEEDVVVGYANSTAGHAWIQNVARWVNATHAVKPRVPLQVFTRNAYVSSYRPELGVQTGHPVPYYAVGKIFGTIGEPSTQIYSGLTVDTNSSDVVLVKSRYYAGSGNPLEEILRAQRIDTVILSGITTAGVILQTATTLYDLDYNVYVILNNTIQAALKTGNSEVNRVILEGISQAYPFSVITIEQAEDMLSRSGPVAY